jgi:hypothetical protein
MGRPGPSRNGWLEALIVAVQARAWAARGRWLTLTELSEVVDLVSLACAREAAPEDVADATARLVELVGDAGWVRRLVRAWRRWSADMHAERDVQAIVAEGQGRRVATLHKYRRGAAGLMAAYVRALLWQQVRADALTALAEVAPDAAARLAARWQGGVPAPPAPPAPVAAARPRWRGRWQRLQQTGCAHTGDWPAAPRRFRDTAPTGDDGAAADNTVVPGASAVDADAFAPRAPASALAEGCRRRGWGWP